MTAEPNAAAESVRDGWLPGLLAVGRGGELVEVFRPFRRGIIEDLPPDQLSAQSMIFAGAFRAASCQMPARHASPHQAATKGASEMAVLYPYVQLKLVPPPRPG